MNAKFLVKTFLAIALLLMVIACGEASPEAPTEVASSESAPAAGFTPSAVCIVPDIVGLPLATAENNLVAVGLQPVRDLKNDDVVAENAVISQDPAAGERLEPCAGDVVIAVSLGPVPVPTDIPSSPTPEPTKTPESTKTPKPTETPEPTETPLPPTPTPTPNPDLIPFASPSDPNALNPVFGWQPGGSEASAYDLTMYPGALTFISGPGVNQWKRRDSAPLVLYPIKGNFEAQVKVVFNSDQQDGQFAGIGIRSIQEPKTWLRLLRGGSQALAAQASQGGRGILLNEIPYTDNTIWLKLERQGSIFNYYYSANESNFVALEKEYVFEMPTDAEIYLFTMSVPENKGFVAQFYDFQVYPK